MAYENFKPTVWSASIQMELERDCILVESCNRQFEGEVGEGKRVKIIGAGRPTARVYTPGQDIAAAETPDDTSLYLVVDQYVYTHFLVDDIDRAQSDTRIMQAYMRGSNEVLRVKRDAYVGSLARFASYISASSSGNSAAEMKALVDVGLQTLREHDVPVGSGNVVIELPPWAYTYFREYLIGTSTNNVELLKNGIVGMYDGARVKLTNSLYNDGTDDYLMIRTTDAIAFAGGISKVEAYSPEKQFSDAVKVLDTYGAGIVRPKELYVIKAHNS